MTAMTHMLSFDVEEYFQVQAAAEGGVRVGDWRSYQRRLPAVIDRTLELLAEHDVSATFFVLGWVARHEPDLVRQIDDAGHEIASHGMTHRMLTELTPATFRTELRHSRKMLEDICGEPVIGYRAPTFSITRKTLWAIDVLAEEGFRYDSSIFPVRHGRYGIPGAPRWMHTATGPAGGQIIEIPPLTLRAFGMNLPAGGGGYLRLLPSWLIRRAIDRAERAAQSAMIYLHPWELDPDQPALPMARTSRFRHRVNLASCQAKLKGLLTRFNFAPVAGVLRSPAELPSHVYRP